MVLTPKPGEPGSPRFGQAGAVLEHFQRVMRQHLGTLI
jgi:hypothetical protein